MKIFGIGLSHTGNKSLTKALNILGYNVLQYAWEEEDEYKICTGYYGYKTKLLDKYDGITDNASAIYYAQFYKAYPGSKFICTLRDKESWLKKMSIHMGKQGKNKERHALRLALYGTTAFNEDRMDFAFERHYDTISRFFNDKENSILYFNMFKGDEWKLLCEFLDKPIPKESFPHIKSKI